MSDGFIQSGEVPPARTLRDALKERNPYGLHLMRQPMLMDFIPMMAPIEDWHIANFLEAQGAWLDEERRLRAEWHK